MAAETIGYAVLAALIYSVVFFAKHHFKPGKPESFDPAKLGATLIVGAVIGVIFYAGGVPITAEAIEIQLGIYISIVALVENVLKIIVRVLGKFIRAS